MTGYILILRLENLADLCALQRNHGAKALVCCLYTNVHPKVPLRLFQNPPALFQVVLIQAALLYSAFSKRQHEQQPYPAQLEVPVQ